MFSLHSIFNRQLLLGGAVFGFAWLMYGRAIVPLQQREVEFLRKRAEFQERLDSTRNKLNAIKDSEQKVESAREALNRLLSARGGDSAMVTLPAEIGQHFSRFGLPSAVVRLAKTQEERDLPGYRRLRWFISVPIPKTDRNVGGLLLAVAELEQQDRYIKALDFALLPDVKDSSLRTAAVTIEVLAEE